MENFEEHILPFFEDDQFIKWITSPDNQSTVYWEKWMKEHPDQVDALLYAKKIALDLREAESPLNPESLSKNIWDKIHFRIEGPQAAIPLFPSKSGRAFYRIAAAVTSLLLLASTAYYFTNHHSRRSLPGPAVAGILENNTLKRTNSSVQNQILYLVDGTKVTLRPGSSIKHTVFLQKDKREVYLDGNAFFEVAKDPDRPFYVYAHDIVLKVLGTSFNVTTDKNNGNITVVVKTGKVSVRKNSSLNKAEFILTTNERIMYSAQSQSIVKSGAENARIPSNINPEAKAISFNFDETPVAEIFATLEEGYGIKINYDENVFSKCIV
ncbi:MAG: FecR family protein, partial [Bacteroidota bacterium]|nr:FecR family protein [Bacteroidota bacterium]